ncbi:MAG: ABC transporter permease subunit, partial [Pseudomonadota bacterium]
MTDAALHNPTYAVGEHPDLPPPPGTTGVIGWLRQNLFSGWVNTILTLATFYLLFISIPPILQWGIFDANISASSRAECAELSSGACWAVVRERIAQFTFGFYPEAERWRPVLALFMLIAAMLPILIEKIPYRKQGLIFAALFPFLAYAVLFGGAVPTFSDVLWTFVPAALLIGAAYGVRTTPFAWLGGTLFWIGVVWGVIGAILLAGGLLFEPVKTRDVGGFLLTMVIGLTGITVSLPIGVVLALGRRSDMLIVRWVCTGFIEFIRGVPLITLLFVASTMLNYFLPPEVEFDLLLRVLIMVTLFASAYMAEVIRGGLQAIPRGQYEAADAMGLQYWQSMRLIIL